MYSTRAYTWEEIVATAPDGYYVVFRDQACCRSTHELWVRKDGGSITELGWRDYANLAPPPTVGRPPLMQPVTNLTLGGERWYRWYPLEQKEYNHDRDSHCCQQSLRYA